MDGNPESCAREILEVVPAVMRSIRLTMRQYRSGDLPVDLTVPQFRVLLFIQRNPAASLSDVAEYMGSTAPSASALVDGLVTRGLVLRQECRDDRRRLQLTLTGNGAALLQRARQETLAHLSDKLSALPEPEIEAIVRAMHALGSIFIPEAAERAPAGAALERASGG